MILYLCSICYKYIPLTYCLPAYENCLSKCLYGVVNTKGFHHLITCTTAAFKPFRLHPFNTLRFSLVNLYAAVLFCRAWQLHCNLVFGTLELPK